MITPEQQKLAEKLLRVAAATVVVMFEDPLPLKPDGGGDILDIPDWEKRYTRRVDHAQALLRIAVEASNKLCEVVR